jgi:hypothetical protein
MRLIRQVAINYDRAQEFPIMGSFVLSFLSILGFLPFETESRPLDLCPRGYELLPNARWLEELESDGGNSLPRRYRPSEGVAHFRTAMAIRTGLPGSRIQLDKFYDDLSVDLPSARELAGFRLEFDPLEFYSREAYEGAREASGPILPVSPFYPPSPFSSLDPLPFFRRR